MCDHIILFLCWSIWCFFHSLLISLPVTGWAESKLGKAFKFYRLFFNIFSCITLIPLAIYTFYLRNDPVFTWDGWLRLPRRLLIVLSLWCFIGGAMKYDFLQLLGIRQIISTNSHRTLNRSGSLDTTGILGIIRHPWYAGSFPVLWARDLDINAIIINSVVSIYLVAGTLFEEKKLYREFGEKYREYQRDVAMFFPFKYLLKKNKEKTKAST